MRQNRYRRKSHGEDHSIFIAFAPKDKPQIAIAVYIENGAGALLGQHQ